MPKALGAMRKAQSTASEQTNNKQTTHRLISVRANKLT
jgi:hypothetical protein